MISSFLQLLEFSLCLFDFPRRGLNRLLHEMMEKNKTALVPRDKEDAITQRAQFPQVAVNKSQDLPQPFYAIFAVNQAIFSTSTGVLHS